MSSPERAADLAACRRLLAAGSRSFDLASRGLPRAIRDDAIALYAFCREADDAIDCSVAPEAALGALRRRLDAIYHGQPANDPVDRAMADLVARHALPRALPEALLEGLAWDVAGRRYDTLADLRAYAARVAGSVGVMMTLIMGKRDADTLTRAAELGVAMQLTNIARDVGEDAALGRCYLPDDWRRAAGDHDAAPPLDVQRAAPLVKRLLAEAERHYAFAEPGIAALPARCRIGIRAAARIYAEIGRVIAARGYDSVSARAIVAPRRKLALLAAAVRARSAQEPAPARPPAGNETAFLIEAVARRPAVAKDRERTLRWWQLSEQWGWVLELFVRLERRERLDSLPRPTSNEDSGSTVTSQR